MISTKNILIRQKGIEQKKFLITKSGKISYARRIRLNQNIFKTLLLKIFNNPNNRGLVKKSVRVGNDIYNALLEFTNNDKQYVSKIINSAVLNEITTKQIDLFDDKWFRYKITVYFTQIQYRQIQNILKELKNKGLKKVTFSSLVRGILYKRLGIVVETHCKDTFERLNRIVQSNEDVKSRTVTNPIHSNKAQQKRNKFKKSKIWQK